MFDTSIVRSRTLAAPRSTLLISILIHTIAVIGAVTLTVASTEMPSNPPKQFELYRPAVLPTPPAPAPPKGRPPQQQQQHPTQQLPPQQIPLRADVAPQSIPELIPVVPDGPASTGPVTAIGSPIGDPNSVSTDPYAVGSDPTIATGPLVPGGDVKPAHVLSRVEPRFPAHFAKVVRTAVVMVRCVIGKDGQIHDPEIVTSSFPPFNEAVLAALNQWKFAPGSMHGRPVDTYFELTVNFEVR